MGGVAASAIAAVSTYLRSEDSIINSGTLDDYILRNEGLQALGVAADSGIAALPTYLRTENSILNLMDDEEEQDQEKGNKEERVKTRQ